MTLSTGFDFDTVIDRRGTHCEKWDTMEARYGVSPVDGLSMWVADMEFRSPQEVNEAFMRAAAFGIHGYYGDDADYRAAVVAWMARRHHTRIEPEWICATNGIVNGLNMAVQAFCTPGDTVIVQPPVYYPFFGAVANNGCIAAPNRLVLEDGKYRMNFEELEALCDRGARMLILCSPHNPGGRVWTRAELERVAAICLPRGVLIVADEIHHDLVFEAHAHTMLAGISDGIRQRVITCTSASKTFNLAGTMTGNMLIADPELRARFKAQMGKCGLYDPNAFGPMAAVAAYTHGVPWLDALLDYLAANRDLVAAAASRMPGVAYMEPEATYLAWLNFSGTGLDMAEVVRRVQTEARLALNHGHTFGPGGEHFMRLNFACPRAMLEDALQRLERVFG
ncbi:MAG: MalY/PatB family protein [Desulfovibrionaceae bacterium]